MEKLYLWRWTRTVKFSEAIIRAEPSFSFRRIDVGGKLRHQLEKCEGGSTRLNNGVKFQSLANIILMDLSFPSLSFFFSLLEPTAEPTDRRPSFILVTRSTCHIITKRLHTSIEVRSIHFIPMQKYCFLQYIHWNSFPWQPSRAIVGTAEKYKYCSWRVLYFLGQQPLRWRRHL